MIEWLNRQNKESTPLMQGDYMLNQANSINWYGLPLFKRDSRLNKKLSRLSPRRPKMTLVESFSGLLPQEEIAQIFEMQDDDL